MIKNLLASIALVLAVAACDSDSDEPDASVSVVLSDPWGPAGGSVPFAVEPDPISVDAGSLEFVAKNQGGGRHNLLIVRGDDPTQLPVNEYGAVIEGDLPEGDFIGKITALDAGTEASALFDLDAGSYILFCNFSEFTVPPIPHFEYMVGTLTVT